MVYINHIYANVEAYDDSRANVYAIVVKNPTSPRTEEHFAAYRDFILNNESSPGVYRLTQNGQPTGSGLTSGYGNGSTFVWKNFTEAYTTQTSQHFVGNVASLNVGPSDNYGVYILGVDEFNNASVITESQFSQGIINQRAAPIVTDDTFEIDIVDGITNTCKLSSEVYFSYKIAVMSINNVSDTVIQSMFTNNTLTYSMSGDVNSGFDAFGVKPFINITLDNLTHVYNDINNLEDFDYAIQSDKDYYVYTWLKNEDAQHILDAVVKVNVNKVNDGLPAISITTPTVPIIYDLGAKITLQLSNYETNASNVDIYVITFSTPYLNMNQNGRLKNALFENHIIPIQTANIENGICEITLDTYYTNIDGVATANNMQTDTRYYTYVRAKDRETGKMSDIHHVSYDTGKDPLTTIIINERTVDKVNLLGTMIVEQSTCDVYIAAILGTLDTLSENNVISFLVGNVTPIYGLTDIPANHNTVIRRSAQPIFQGSIILGSTELTKVAADLEDSEIYETMDASTNATIYMYVIDEYQHANLTYIPLPIPPGIDPAIMARTVTPQIVSEANLDKSFIVSCTNADSIFAHHTMAFEHTVVHTNVLQSGMLLQNLIQNGTVVSNADPFEITNWYDENGTTPSLIQPHSAYNIYTVARDVATGRKFHVTSSSVLSDLIAEHIPEIRWINIEFNT